MTSPRKKLLVLTSRFPYPPIGGEKIRLYHILRHLAPDWEIHLLSLYSSGHELEHASGLESLCTSIRTVRIGRVRKMFNTVFGWMRGYPLQVGYYLDGSAQRIIEEAIASVRPDLTLVHLVRMLEYARSLPEHEVVLELTDAISMNYGRIRFPRNIRELIYFFERKRLLRYEVEAAESARASVLVAHEDAEYLRRAGAPGDRLHVIRNGAEPALSPVDVASSERRIVFLGNMRSAQNEDMCLYFHRDIFPLVRARCPDAVFIVVGAFPSKRVLALHDEKTVRVTGKVPDIRAELETASVSVCPMRYGAGIQNKILESMAHGIPVVTTSFGLEGIDADPGNEILVGDNAHDFAEQVIKLLESPEIRGRLGRKAHAFIAEKFRWETHMTKYSALMAGTP